VRTRPLVAITGTSDIDRRIDLMQELAGSFATVAVGSSEALRPRFAACGLEYFTYPLSHPAHPYDGVRALYRLTALFRALKPDIVHTFDTVPSVWGRLAAHAANVPAIVGTLPGLGRLYSGASVKHWVLRSAYELLQRMASRRSDITVFQHHDDAHRFVEAGIVPVERARVIPGSGIRTDQFCRTTVPATDVKTIRTAVGASDHGVVVTMVSQIMRAKGVLEFAEAARLLRQTHNDVRFVLVGGGDSWRGDSLSSTERQSLSQSVQWLGERRDIPAILAASDIFVLPSYYGEGIPRVLLEAASMQLPLVASDLPGCRAMLRNDVEGILVPPRQIAPLVSAIEGLIENPAERERLARAARSRAVAEFDLRIIARDTASVYSWLLRPSASISC
jgi:glycosyltransferase involved in cell wall biosynthesis